MQSPKVDSVIPSKKKRKIKNEVNDKDEINLMKKSRGVQLD